MANETLRLPWTSNAPGLDQWRQCYLENRRPQERRTERLTIASLLLDEMLMQAADDNDDLFSELMRDAFDRGQVSRSRLAWCINASAAQVGRWANKGSAAPVYARRMILWSTARIILEEEGIEAPPFSRFAASRPKPLPQQAGQAAKNSVEG